MFNQNDCMKAERMFHSGQRPSDILRFFALQHEEASIPDLMQLMRDAFSITYEDSQCIGGWWHDGTGELSDEQLNSFLAQQIRKAITGRQ